MATIQQQYDENQENQDQGAQSTQQLSTASQPSTGGAVGGQGGSTVGGGARYQSPEKKGSGRFMNLQKYLEANTGAGEKLAGGIGSMAGREGQKVAEESKQADQISQNIQNEKDRLAQATEYNKQISEGQAQNVAQNNLDDYTKLRLGQNDLANIQQAGQDYQNIAQSGINRLQDLSDQAKSETGRFNLLRQAYGGGKPGSNYGLGQRRLDQLFLQAEGGGQLNQLQQDLSQTAGTARDRYQQFQDTFGQGVQDIGDQTLAAQQQVAETLGGFDPEAGGAFGNLYTNLTGAQEARRQNIADTVNRAQQQLATGTISQSIADELGISPGMQIYDMNLGDWASRIGAGDTDVTMADVISQDQQAQLDALQMLAGIDPSEQYLGEKEGSTLGFAGDEFTSEAGYLGDTFDTRFFDRNYADALDRDVKPGFEDWSIMDELNAAMGYSSTGTGFGLLPYVTRLEDPTSRAQLEQAVNQAAAAEARNWIPASGMTDVFQRYLDAYDRDANRRINIVPDEQNIETGGYFNVT